MQAAGVKQTIIYRALLDKLLNDVFCRWQKMMYSFSTNNDVLFHKMMFLPLAKMSEAALRLEL